MNRADIVAEVMDRLNLTSEDAKSRIQKRVQTRYGRVTSSIGLATSRRVTATITVNPTTVTTLPDLRLQNIEKVLRIQRVTDNPKMTRIDEVTYDEATAVSLSSGNPSKWAVKTMGPDYVIITFDRFPSATPFDIIVQGIANVLTLGDNDEPLFPADFHEVLIEGALSDEYRKMEKGQQCADAEERYMAILSDLRFFIVKSGYLDQYQGKNQSDKRFYWPWNIRIALE